MTEDKTAVRSDQAPAPIGPYSQAIASGDLLFCSGQVALDPATGQMLGGGTVEGETEVVLRNLGAVLEAGGCSFADVLKTTIYLVDMADFPVVNEIYAACFPEGSPPPARATVAVSGLPKGAVVEIDAVARR
jgi:2-iminobutanoate/2-iminopropanoate deaminase